MLADILSRLTTRISISWSLIEFYGTGTAPKGKGMVDFETEIQQSSDGYRFSHEGLKKFAAGVTDIYDLSLVGMDDGRKLVEIRAIDSDCWEVTIDEEFSSFTADGLAC